MTRNEHPADGYVRRLPLVSDEQARRWSDRDAKQALFQEITTMPVELNDPPAAPTRARIPRRTFVVAATLASLSVATVGGAVVVSSLASTSTAVACHTSDDSEAIVDAVTGDPVQDCADLWERETGAPPPPLVAYDNGSGGVAVIAEDADVPEGWQPLEPGVVQDPDLIQLEAALGDVGSGLNAACHPLDDGRVIAERELERLDLTGWSVTSERGEADGNETCTFFYLDGEQQQVVLIPLDGADEGAGDAPYSVFARDLSQALDDDCLTVEAAAEAAERLAGAAGIEGVGLVVHEVTDDDASCSRADVNVGGRVEVTIRGPRAAS